MFQINFEYHALEKHIVWQKLKSITFSNAMEFLYFFAALQKKINEKM
jgi:hypothetical protein